MEWGLLEIEILKITKAVIEDLVLPRLAWINISGLPICAFSATCLGKILKKWGTLASSNYPTIFHSELSNPRVCLVTQVMEEIQGRLDINISGKIFNIEITEVKNVVFWKEEGMHKQRLVSDWSLNNSNLDKPEERGNYSVSLPEFFSPQEQINSSTQPPHSPSVERLEDSCGSDDSINYLDPVAEEIKYRSNRLEDWNRDSGGSAPSLGERVPSFSHSNKLMSNLSGDSVNTRKWTRRTVDSLSSCSANFSFDHDVLNQDEEISGSLIQPCEPCPDICSKMQNLRIKSKKGRQRKGGRFSFFDRKRRVKRHKELVPDWSVGRYVRVWKSEKTIKARGKEQRNRKRKAKDQVIQNKGDLGSISAEDLFQLGIKLGLKPVKDLDQMLSLIEARM